MYLGEAKEMMEKVIKHTGIELNKIRAGKASPTMLDSIMVEYYGSPTPLAQVATVSVPDARSLMIRPFERKMIMDIERAIRDSELGLNPTSDGETVRINMPPMTEERRRDLVKQVKVEAEASRVSLRNVRKEINELLRKLQKEGASEDEVKTAEDKVQKTTDSYVAKVEQIIEAKEKEIMTV